MAPAGCRDATAVAYGGEKAREAHNTPWFLEEQREARGSLEPAN
jgi:hypothetical protein